MNNLIVSLKKFLRNKNTITVLGIIIILVLLYYGYTKTVNTTINPISVPVAARTIPARTQISSADITYKKIAEVMIDDNVVRNPSEILGSGNNAEALYTNLNVTIPEGSVFYKSWLVKKNEIAGNWIEEIKTDEGYEAYYMDTNVTDTLGNNVIPGSVIDIYMQAADDNGQIMYGRLLENIKILVVHDGSGKDVFGDTANVGSPSKLGFQLSHDFYVLLHKAQQLSGIKLTIAPQGTKVDVSGDVSVSSATLRDYIDARTVTLDDEVSTSDEKEEKTDQNQETNNQENNNG